MTPITPGDILEIAETNHIVDVALMGWRTGATTWEQALMQAVVNLARHAKHVASNVLAEAANETRKLDEPVLIEEGEAITVTADGSLKVIRKSIVEGRIEYFRKHGLWPEQSPVGVAIDRMVGHPGPSGS